MFQFAHWSIDAIPRTTETRGRAKMAIATKKITCYSKPTNKKIIDSVYCIDPETEKEVKIDILETAKDLLTHQHELEPQDWLQIARWDAWKQNTHLQKIEDLTIQQASYFLGGFHPALWQSEIDWRECERVESFLARKIENIVFFGHGRPAIERVHGEYVSKYTELIEYRRTYDKIGFVSFPKKAYRKLFSEGNPALRGYPTTSLNEVFSVQINLSSFQELPNSFTCTYTDHPFLFESEFIYPENKEEDFSETPSIETASYLVTDNQAQSELETLRGQVKELQQENSRLNDELDKVKADLEEAKKVGGEIERLKEDNASILAILNRQDIQDLIKLTDKDGKYYRVRITPMLRTFVRAIDEHDPDKNVSFKKVVNRKAIKETTLSKIAEEEYKKIGFKKIPNNLLLAIADIDSNKISE